MEERHTECLKPYYTPRKPLEFPDLPWQVDLETEIINNQKSSNIAKRIMAGALRVCAFNKARPVMLLSNFETTYLRIPEGIRYVRCSTTDGDGVNITEYDDIGEEIFDDRGKCSNWSCWIIDVPLRESKLEASLDVKYFHSVMIREASDDFWVENGFGIMSEIVKDITFNKILYMWTS